MQWVSFVLTLILWDKMGAAPISGCVMMPSNADIPCHIAPSVNNPVDSYMQWSKMVATANTWIAVSIFVCWYLQKKIATSREPVFEIMKLKVPFP